MEAWEECAGTSLGADIIPGRWTGYKTSFKSKNRGANEKKYECLKSDLEKFADALVSETGGVDSRQELSS